jgi:hypothetical protein
MSRPQTAEARTQAKEQRRARRSIPRCRLTNGTSKYEGKQVEKSREVITTDAESEARMLVSIIAPQHAQTVKFYEYQELETKEAIRHADDLEPYQAAQARICPAHEQNWGRIAALAKVDLEAALDAWLRVQDHAFDELESGMRAAEVTGHTAPLERARFLAVRDKFAEEWQPRGGIEAALVDMLAQCFSLYLYWMEISHKRAVENVDAMRTELKRFEDSAWKNPYQSAADAIEQAHRMVDRYNRIFLRTLRQMRDLRRYAPPVIVNNGGQVNFANQQMNVAQSKA